MRLECVARAFPNGLHCELQASRKRRPAEFQLLPIECSLNGADRELYRGTRHDRPSTHHYVPRPGVEERLREPGKRITVRAIIAARRVAGRQNHEIGVQPERPNAGINRTCA